jgi:voltage-dependent potassium channel beta subunit
MAPTDIGMKYRFLGDSGLLVSAMGFGCMVQDETNVDLAYELMTHAFAHGVNYFDTAEVYGAGSSERVVGTVIQRGIANGVWTREDLVVSTKIYFGPKPGPNSRGLGRKHLVEGTKVSLARLQLDYVDVLFAHRPEKFTPIEEVVRAMNFIINQGWAFYWGTSEWHESDVLEACAIADRLGLIRPIVEQPEYNLLARSRVEVEFQALYSKYKLGLTTWSPLAFGMLTGKYAQGIPDKTRLSNAYFAGLIGDVDARAQQVEQLRPIAQELDCTLAQLAIAWAVSNSHVSSVLLGASSVAQLDENLRAFPLVAKMTPEIKARIEALVPSTYTKSTYDGYYTLRQQYL